MENKIKLLSKDEVNKFTTLIKTDSHAKLTAQQLVNLDPHIYNDYLKKIKYFAGFHGQSSSKYKQKGQQKDDVQVGNFRSKLKKQSPNSVSSSLSSPSYYYTKRTQILSMKQFVILLQQSKKKRKKEDRVQFRKKQKEFVRYVGRSIQSSHSQRNLRLTSSSANRIAKRLNQINYEKVYE